MEQKKKIILAILIASALVIFLIIQISPEKPTATTSFITAPDKIDLSAYTPRISIDEAGKSLTSISETDPNTLTWEDVPELPEIPLYDIYIQDNKGNLTPYEVEEAKPITKQIATQPRSTNNNSNKKSTTPQYQKSTPEPTTPLLSDEDAKAKRRALIEANYSSHSNSYSIQNISCVVHTTQNVKGGQVAKLRVTEDVTIAGLIIPKNTILSASVSFSGNRCLLNINRLAIKGQFHNIALSGLGDDGQVGILIDKNSVSNDVANSITQDLVSTTSNVVSQVGGVAGKLIGSVARTATNTSRSENNKEITLLDRQRITFITQ